MSNELILLVDDEAAIVQLARMYLEREGFRIESGGLVLSREQLLQKAWGFDFYSQTRTVEVREVPSSNLGTPTEP